MGVVIALGVVAALYGVVFFLDFFFKSCMHHPYAAFLNGTGLTIKLMRLEWYTTAFNRRICSWSTNRRLLRPYFDLGVYCCLALVPFSMAVLVYAVVQAFSTSAETSPGTAATALAPVVEVELLIPGVTLPFDELGFYVVTLMICTVVHEVGHAVASYLEDVPLNGIGLRVLFILPMAYADLSTEALDRIKNWGKLRIFCAGVWHNLLLALLGYLCLCSVAPLLAPFYSTSSGVYVLSVDKEAAVYGPRGIFPRDVIVQINRVAVTNGESYYEALVEAGRERPKFCVTSEYVHAHDESKKVETGANGLVECCDRTVPENLCFEHFIVNGVLEMPPYFCLHIRRLIEHSGGLCDEQDNCAPGLYCVKPLLDNHTTILQIKRSSSSGGHRAPADVLYLGHPGDVYRAVKWSAFVPKTRLLSPQLPEVLQLLAKYVTVFSFGLAFVNILPCYGFDGQYIVHILVHQLLAGRLVRRRKTRDAIAMACTMMGSFLLFLLVANFFKENVVGRL